ncbi:hypothetical protein AB4037_30460 [Labrys sp. KB_33_2]
MSFDGSLVRWRQSVVLNAIFRRLQAAFAEPPGTLRMTGNARPDTFLAKE